MLADLGRGETFVGAVVPFADGGGEEDGGGAGGGGCRGGGIGSWDAGGGGRRLPGIRFFTTQIQ